MSAVETKVCRQPGCGRDVHDARGIYAGLCRLHKFEQRSLRARAKGRTLPNVHEALRGAAGEDVEKEMREVRENVLALPSKETCEARVRALIPVSKKVDLARRRQERAKKGLSEANKEFASAQAEFVAALRTLIGPGSG